MFYFIYFILIIFLFMFNKFFKKYYFKILLTNNIRRHILESWKKLLQILLLLLTLRQNYKWYVIFTYEYTDEQIKTPTELYTVFYRLYGKLLKKNINNMKRVNFYFDVLCLSINVLINLLLKDQNLITIVF